MRGGPIYAEGAGARRLAVAFEKMAKGGKRFVAGAREVNRIAEEEGSRERFTAAAVEWVAEAARLAEFRAMIIREALDEGSGVVVGYRDEDAEGAATAKERRARKARRTKAGKA